MEVVTGWIDEQRVLVAVPEAGPAALNVAVGDSEYGIEQVDFVGTVVPENGVADGDVGTMSYGKGDPYIGERVLVVFGRAARHVIGRGHDIGFQTAVAGIIDRMELEDGREVGPTSEFDTQAGAKK